ncbi:hypothetical protein [Gimesia aquarii]|uniref:DUF4878 domain-containing protein n=1 Tax=Gimesia aquarii TaxID=2527964 RepID=A0A517W0H5_9PLAN|nr:hypothetical protein [Gimesia aquarii]QDT98754.1 hypothetical protein V144x_42610 [Gimesia aquarii]
MKNMILCFLFGLLVGCGSGAEVKPSVEQDVYAHVMGLGDSISSDEMFEAAFISGAAPKNRKDYGKYVFVVDGGAEINGDEAIVPVKILGGYVSSQERDKVVKEKPSEKTETKMTWKLQREGDEWKIKEAPLPG